MPVKLTAPTNSIFIAAAVSAWLLPLVLAALPPVIVDGARYDGMWRDGLANGEGSLMDPATCR